MYPVDPVRKIAIHPFPFLVIVSTVHRLLSS
jgi:hypothetical protein